MQDELQHVTNEYDALSPGVPPCRVDADAPFAKAAYAQMKYEAAYVDWVNAVNDATEVCSHTGRSDDDFASALFNGSEVLNE